LDAREIRANSIRNQGKQHQKSGQTASEIRANSIRNQGKQPFAPTIFLKIRANNRSPGKGKVITRFCSLNTDLSSRTFYAKRFHILQTFSTIPQFAI